MLRPMFLVDEAWTEKQQNSVGVTFAPKRQLNRLYEPNTGPFEAQMLVEGMGVDQG